MLMTVKSFFRNSYDSQRMRVKFTVDAVLNNKIINLCG